MKKIFLIISLLISLNVFCQEQYNLTQFINDYNDEKYKNIFAHFDEALTKQISKESFIEYMMAQKEKYGDFLKFEKSTKIHFDIYTINHYYPKVLNKTQNSLVKYCIC